MRLLNTALELQKKFYESLGENNAIRKIYDEMESAFGNSQVEMENICFAEGFRKGFLLCWDVLSDKL